MIKNNRIKTKMNERLRKQIECKTKLTDGSPNKNDTERAEFSGFGINSLRNMPMMISIFFKSSICCFSTMSLRLKPAYDIEEKKPGCAGEKSG